MVFHNGSNYDYHFIIKELAEEFNRERICLGENTKNTKKKKKLKELVNVERKIIKIISYKLQFIESTRCMASYLSNLVNLAKGIHKPRCRYGYYNKKRGTCGIKYKDCECCLEYKNVKVDLIEHKCLCYNKY